jgi:hypothetical protein
MSRTSRRILATLTFSLLLTPSFALARPQARTRPARVATAAQPGLIDLFRAGLSQLMDKLAPISQPSPTPAPGGGAGVRIDPEGSATSPGAPPVGHP